MKNLIAFLTMLLIGISVQAQNETRDLKSFSQLDVSGSLDVSLYEGEPKVAITMVKGDIDELEVIQKGNRLSIKFKDKNNWSGNRKANIDLYVQKLSSISVSAGAEVVSEFTLSADEFYADASSGAELSIALETNALDADVSSGARIIIEGKTDQLNVDASSGAAYNGKRMIAKDVDADVSSGASIKVWATEKLEADASSGGSIKYKGDPRDMNIDSGKWSGGSVKKI